MLETIVSFFESIGEFFSKIWEVLTFVFDELTQFFSILAPALSFFGELLANIHPLFFGFGTAILVVLLIYIILGRTAGGD